MNTREEKEKHPTVLDPEGTGKNSTKPIHHWKTITSHLSENQRTEGPSWGGKTPTT